VTDKIDIFRNSYVTFRKSTVTFCNDPQLSVTLHCALYRLQLPKQRQSAFSDMGVAMHSSQITLRRTCYQCFGQKNYASDGCHKWKKAPKSIPSHVRCEVSKTEVKLFTCCTAPGISLSLMISWISFGKSDALFPWLSSSASTCKNKYKKPSCC